MIAETLFLFIYVQLFYIINKFLLQTVIIVIYTQCFFESICYALFDFFDTFFFIGRDRFQ